jgi:uncharacterized protein (TIGR02145 family)
MKVNLKKAFKYVFLVVIAVLGTTATKAQSVQKIGTNQNTISTSAVLELESTTKGFLPPRMTTTQRNAIASPTAGLVIYNTTTQCLEYSNGISWYNKCDGTTTAVTFSGGNASSGGTAVVSDWTSTLGCSVGAGTNNSPAGVIQGGVNQTMVQGTSATGVATVTLVATVTTAGTYVISTTTVNGVTFSASGTFGTTGAQTVTLTANGTPTYAGNYVWTTSSTPSITIYGSVLTTNAPFGSSYTAHFNGIISGVNSTPDFVTQTTGETFNNNTACQNQPISAQGCAGVTTVTTSGGRAINTVNINGQCWLQSFLIEKPTVYSGYTKDSYITSLPTTTDDQGYWGYFNTTTTDGTAGWGATEPVVSEGILYQWCGVMNATISERSRGICPAGWHIPSDCEMMYLEHGMGVSIANQYVLNSRVGNSAATGKPGTKMLVYQGGNSATNASGFALQGPGTRFETPYSGLIFYYRGFTTYLWTSSAWDPDRVVFYSFHQSFMGMVRNNVTATGTNLTKALGNSVRCLKD